MKARSYILEVYYAGSWRRFYTDTAWPTRRDAERYCKATMSVNDWIPSKARIVDSELPVAVPAHVAAFPKRGRVVTRVPAVRPWSYPPEYELAVPRAVLVTLSPLDAWELSTRPLWFRATVPRLFTSRRAVDYPWPTIAIIA